MKKLIIFTLFIINISQVHAFERTAPICKPIIYITPIFSLLRRLVNTYNNTHPSMQEALRNFTDRVESLKKRLGQVSSLQFMSFISHEVYDIKLRLIDPENSYNAEAKRPSNKELNGHAYQSLILKNYIKEIENASAELKKCSNTYLCGEALETIFFLWLYDHLIKNKPPESFAEDCHFKLDILTTFAYLNSLVAELNNDEAVTGLRKLEPYIIQAKKDLEEKPWLFMKIADERVNKIKKSLLPQELLKKDLYLMPEELKKFPYRDLILHQHELSTLEAIKELKTCSDPEQCEKLLRLIFDYWLYADFIRE